MGLLQFLRLLDMTKIFFYIEDFLLNSGLLLGNSHIKLEIFNNNIM